MNDNAMTRLLFMILTFMVVILLILIVAYIILSLKSKKRKKVKESKDVLKTSKKVTEKASKGNVKSTSYNQQSIYKFMKFDKIEDNMIVQKNGKRYLMVIECQGVNYDLMSQMEKVAVEEGFQQFLNTLRHPIQIYIQTRTINLEDSIARYKEQIKGIEEKYRDKELDYARMVESGMYTKAQLEKQFFELTKQKNMVEYSRDLINTTEKMSLNRSVLNKKYYIIIPFYPEDSASGSQYAVEEIRNMAFSELYTKSQTIIRTLSACSVNGKILNSKELIDLLYVAYNRDEAEVFGTDKAIRSGYDDLYSTAPDVFEKKIQVLNHQIEEEAMNLAVDKVEKARSRIQQQAEEQEQNMDELIGKMAQMIIENNKNYVEEDVAEEAIREIREELGQEINNNDDEGDEDNEQIQKTTSGRNRKAG